MPKAKILNLVKGDKIGTETDYRDALPVNMLGIPRDVFGVSGYMIQHPGLTTWAQGQGLDRGGIWNERQQNHFRVSGGSLLSVSSDGVASVIGAISGSGPVSLPYSFNTQGVVADGRFWLYDGTTLTEVTDPDLGNPIDCVWVDNYYFFTDGEFIYHTDITSESSIDPLKFATAEYMPDGSLGVAKTQDNKVVVFGRYSTEYFQNVASENFAFTRVQTRASKMGIVGTHCKTELNGKWYILGSRKGEGIGVHIMQVGQEQRVSSREIEKLIGKYTESQLVNVVLESRHEDGCSFLIVHLPNETLIFNETLAGSFGLEQSWSIVKSDVVGSGEWRGKHGVFDPRVGSWIYGDKRSIDIGILDDTVATEYGNTNEWLLYTPFTYLDGQSIDELEVETLPGHGGSEGAKVSVSLTYNGVTHGMEWFEMYGNLADYGKRFVIRRLGYVRDWFGMKLRGVSSSRMAFSRAFIKHG